jgi:MerR family transcriptional regulator, light-induced transcriptional regulator
VNDELLSPGVAARRLGVAVTTLRSWHQRYGLGPSGHHPGHHRRYTGTDMARLILMQQLVTAGVTPAEAARWAKRSPLPESAVPASSVGAGSSGAVTDIGSAPVGAAQLDRSAGQSGPDRSAGQSGPDRSAGQSGLDRSAGSGRGGGYALALGDAEPAARGLGRAALRLDALGVRDMVASAIAARGVIAAWDQVIRPVLVAIGERVARTQELVEVEHMLSGCISAAFGALPRPPRDTPVRLVLACADEEQHSLPIEALAAALAERGVPARVLGARVPPAALGAAVRRTGPAAVLLWAHTTATADPRQLDALLTGRGRPALVSAAGPGWQVDALPAGLAVPTDLRGAVDLFAAAAG